jgi:hypothetical protein
MNKRLEREIGEKLVEKRGWHWALMSFAMDCGETWELSGVKRTVKRARRKLEKHK